MQVNNVKHILGNVKTGTRTELKDAVEGRRVNASLALKNVFYDCLLECNNPAEVIQLEHAFLLAVKTVQDSLNHWGKPPSDKDSYYVTKNTKYSSLDKNDQGLNLLSKFLSDENLKNLKLVCFHRRVSPFHPDRKYSFFGDTCYTRTANNLRDNIQKYASEKIQKLEQLRLQAQPRLQPKASLTFAMSDLEPDIAHELCRKLRLPHTAQAIEKFALSNGNAVRVGKIQIKRLNPQKVRLTVFDNNRSYVPNETWGANKLLKVHNFDIVLTNKQLEDLKAGNIEAYTRISQFVSNARWETQGMNVDKNVLGERVFKPGSRVISADEVRDLKFTRSTREPDEESWRKDGFRLRTVLDKNGNKKVIYVSPYKGMDLITAIQKYDRLPRTKEGCLAFVKKFANTVFEKAQNETLYDVKLENALLNRKNEPHIIDYAIPGATFDYMLPHTKDAFLKMAQGYLQENYTKKQIIEIISEKMQVPLLNDAVVVNMVRLGYILGLKVKDVFNYMQTADFRHITRMPDDRARHFQQYIRQHEAAVEKAAMD